jgi:hypothetical protein
MYYMLIYTCATGGLVVASSNLVAPTNKDRDLADLVESLFIYGAPRCRFGKHFFYKRNQTP